MLLVKVYYVYKGKITIMKNMKIKAKLIQNVRISPQRGELLRELVHGIWKETGVSMRESEIINFLLDEGIGRIEVENNELKLK